MLNGRLLHLQQGTNADAKEVDHLIKSQKKRQDEYYEEHGFALAQSYLEALATRRNRKEDAENQVLLAEQVVFDIS